MPYKTILYEKQGKIARIILNRPRRLNSIVPPMPEELESAIKEANRDPEVSVIVLKGKGRSFCIGFEFSGGLEHFKEWGICSNREQWDPGRDMMINTNHFLSPTQGILSIWRSSKPVIAQIHGWCVGGGSDMALCADLIIAADDAQFGTPYARAWGCYLTGMWIYRLGLTKVKALALTGDQISAPEALEMGLINKVVPRENLEEETQKLAEKLAHIPMTQLAAMKLIVNQAYDNMGLNSTQILGPVLDGFMRNTPESLDFIKTAQDQGVKAALMKRDGPFGDYSQAPAGRKPIGLR